MALRHFKSRLSFSDDILQDLAHRLQKLDTVPRGLKKFLSVIIFLTISGLCISGGTLVIASFMHVLIVKADMPPTLTYPVSVVVASQALGTPGQTGEASKFATHANPTAVAQTAPPVQDPASANISMERVVMVPRPTLSSALNKLAVRLRNPADAVVQSDAVDIGLIFQREIHRLLLGVLDNATRSRVQIPSAPQGIPLTNSQ